MTRPPFDKEAAAKKMFSKPREIKIIEQDYANQAAKVGDLHFKMELNRAPLNAEVLKLAKLKDEWDKAKKLEPDTTDSITPEVMNMPEEVASL